MKEKGKDKKRMFGLNNDILFVIVLLLIALNSYNFILSSKDVLTGGASAYGTTSICIGTDMGLGIPLPAGGWINGTFNASVTASDAEYVRFHYFRMPGAEQFFGQDYDPDDDGYFNHTLNTSELLDGNCRYRITAHGYGACNVVKTAGSGIFTINNHDVAPINTEFDNPESTNFSQYTSWVDIAPARLVNPLYGMIQPQAQNYDNMDLDTMFNISYNRIYVNVSIDSNCFNDVLYRITFFNVTQFAEPVVIRNGGRCGDACFDFSYNNGNYTFGTRISGEATFWIVEGGNLTINYTYVNKTFDNSPTFNFSTYIEGSIRNISVAARCYYKTDYNPLDFTLASKTDSVNHSIELPEQNWSYLPTGMGHYGNIQNANYFRGRHNISFNCTAVYGGVLFPAIGLYDNSTFTITFTQRDRVFYADGDEVNLYLRLEEGGLNVTADFSQLDSGFDPSSLYVNNTGLDYNITYTITPGNTRSDGQYNVTIEAFNSTGYETMNGSIFIHLHNTFIRDDIDDAFDCWSFKPGYYFDEDGCSWDSDVNMVAKRLVDILFTEISCYDGLDNDGDGDTDIDDADCAGIYYDIRRALGIDSAFLGDPCDSNICYVCLGTDDNGDGICDEPDGVNVQYLNYVRPGGPIRALFTRQARIDNSPVRVSVNYLDASFDVEAGKSSIMQLPYMELGGCSGGTDCKSVTGTTFDSTVPIERNFTGYLNERITTSISNTSVVAAYAGMAVGRSIRGSSVFQNMVFFEVSDSAILNESDIAAYCFDDIDNDLNGVDGCLDRSCNLTVNPANPSQVCEFGHELTCDDGYDNDWDGYTDCQDNDCFKKDGTNGPCYAIEDYGAGSCADSVNNDFDWGDRCNESFSTSYENRTLWGASIALTDCLDYDCDGNIGDVGLGALCEYCTELTCNDSFNNDGDTYFDCLGNAFRNNYERDCDRWHDPDSPGAPQCPTVETNCTDDYDNDLDSDSRNGEYSWLGIPVYGGYDCQDLDCDDEIGDPSTGALCQFGNETECDDGFDNDGDGFIDCDDPSTCKGLSGLLLNLTGMCRPCASMENITVDSCRDGDDNDNDGDIDCDDLNCRGRPGSGVGICGLSENNCTDGIDNDYDWATDYDDSDCVLKIVTDDELGPGQCDDGIDNDDDGAADCGDSDCNSSIVCQVGSFEYGVCNYVDTVGVISVCQTEFVRAGNNYTVGLSRPALNVGSVLFILGNSEYSLKNITPVLNTTTTFMTGTTTNFVLLRGSYGLLAQNSLGFNEDLDMDLTATVDRGIVPGFYDNYLLTSVEGSFDDVVMQMYVAENEPPVVTNITAIDKHEDVGGGAVDVLFSVNVTDNQTYNSGIAFCTMELPGHFLVNSTSCSYTTNLTSGTYNVSTIAYDGALNPSDLFWREMDLSVWTYPTQSGGFYNPYPAENYPAKDFFNYTENLNIGVNFEGGSGFVADAQGCTVEFMNSTDVIYTGYVDLNVVGGDAVCNGQISMLPLLALSNSSRGYPEAVFYFRVSVNDTSGRQGVSSIQDMNYCYYYYDNSSSKNRCFDACLMSKSGNELPVLMVPIPNQTWPRGTSLTNIDLDDYFMDPNGDTLTYNWSINTNRIEVTIDENNLVTFTPDSTFYGHATITFYASDLFGSTPSNVVELEVSFRNIPSLIVPSGGGGGGGGAAARNLSAEQPICEEDWICTDWGPCLPTGFQTRNCRDRNECGSTKDMPDTIRDCLYRPTCKDRIRNGGEEGVDCGGPCPPCPSCSDGIRNQQEVNVLQIMSDDPLDLSDCGGPFCPECPTCSDNRQNQGEESIDCGGPCGSCATCSDGIRNQGEMNVDCGGPCIACEVRVTEMAINWHPILLVISLLLLLCLFLLTLLFGVFKRKFFRFKSRLLNYYMRLIRMFDRKKLVEKDLPIMKWLGAHLDGIEEGIPSKSVEDSVNGIDRLVRIFFKRVFLIRYAFTHDELVKELERHRMPLVLRKATDLLFEELAQIKYGGESIDKTAVKTLAGQVRVIAERIVNEIEVKKKAKIRISERDIAKIEQTLVGAHHMSVKEAVKKMKR